MSNINAQHIIDIINEANVIDDANALQTDKPLSDQGVDSLDFSGILFNLEEAYGIVIPDEEVDELKTINDITSSVNTKLNNK